MNPNRRKYLAHQHAQSALGDLVVEIVSGRLRRSYYIIWWATMIGFLGIVAFIVYASITDDPQPPQTNDPVKNNNGWKFIPIFAVFILVLYVAPIILKEKASFINVIGNVCFTPRSCIVTLKDQRTELKPEQISEMTFNYNGYMGQVSGGAVLMRSPNPTFSGTDNYLAIHGKDNYFNLQLFIISEWQAERLKEAVGRFNESRTSV